MGNYWRSYSRIVTLIFTIFFILTNSYSRLFHYFQQLTTGEHQSWAHHSLLDAKYQFSALADLVHTWSRQVWLCIDSNWRHSSRVLDLSGRADQPTSSSFSEIAQTAYWLYLPYPDICTTSCCGHPNSHCTICVRFIVQTSSSVNYNTWMRGLLA